jgi:hypothetical protein
LARTLTSVRTLKPARPSQQRIEAALADLDGLLAQQLAGPRRDSGDRDGPELDLRLLVDHRERLVRQRVALNSTLQWHLCGPSSSCPAARCSTAGGRPGSPRVARRLARAEQSMRVRIARDELRRIRELSQTIKALEAEIAQLVATIAPQLLSEPGFGALTAAKLIGEIARAQRFATPAKLAAPAASRRSAPAPATRSDNVSTKAATARSTPHCTA